MRVAICSDLHLEFGDLFLKNKEEADVLILAGDIMIAHSLDKAESEHGKQFKDFIQRASSEFPHVIAVAGNHEFYGGYWNKSIDILKREYGRFDNIHFLENGSVEINNVLFVGATLWTNMNSLDHITMYQVKLMMNDFRKITNDSGGYRKLIPNDCVDRFIKSLNYLNETISSTSKDVVVVSHHAPTFNSIHQNHKNDYHINGAYASNLGEFILDHPNIKLWAHGHIHDSNDYLVGDTRVVSNPRGYVSYEVSEDEEFNPFIVDI